MKKEMSPSMLCVLFWTAWELKISAWSVKLKNAAFFSVNHNKV
jgi:hypothetical protein